MRLTARSAAGAAIVAGLAVLAAGAAQARPALYTMTCSEALAFVKNRGVVIADAGPNVTVRIVPGRQYCDRLQKTKPLFVKTRDNPQCLIGLRCATEAMSAE